MIFYTFFTSFMILLMSCKDWAFTLDGLTHAFTLAADGVARTIFWRASITMSTTRKVKSKGDITSAIEAFDLLRVAVLESFVKNSWRQPLWDASTDRSKFSFSEEWGFSKVEPRFVIYENLFFILLVWLSPAYKSYAWFISAGHLSTALRRK